MSIRIQKISPDDAQDEGFVALYQAYANECASDGFGKWQPNWEMYKALDRAKVLHAYAAYDGDRPVGLLSFMSLPQPHHDPIVTIDAIFVLREYRRGTLPMRLLSIVERYAKESGYSLVLGTQPDTDFDKVLSKNGRYECFSKTYRRKQ